MKLAEMRPGEYAKILSIADDTVRAQAIRFGIAEGAVVQCEGVIAAGPIVVRRGQMRYAIGRALADQIEVLPQLGRQRKRGQRRHGRGHNRNA